MKKRKRILTKLSLFFAFALLCIISFVVPTKAYYSDENGNLVSDNLLNPTFINTNSLFISDFHSLQTYGLESNTSYTLSFENLTSDLFYFRVNWSSDNYTSWVRSDSYLTFNTASYTEFAILSDRTFNSSLYKVMLNSGSSALPYEPYGIYYSQINYDNYGSSQYAQGYSDGYNSIYNNLVDVNLSNQINGFGMGIYDSTGETFVQRATISSSGFENNYYYINFNSLVNNYYVVNIGFNDTYLINNFSIQTANVSNPSLEANGYVLGTSSTYTYNGTTYGWFNLSYNEPVNQITFRFQNTRDLTQLKLYINGKRLNVLDSLESYNEGLENGKEIGYNNGYTDGYAQGSKDNTEITSSGFKVLFNSILSYPVNFFREVFNFEFMGINIAALITFIISLVIVGFIWNKFRK